MISSIINFGVRAQPTTVILRRTRTGSTYSCNCSNYSCNCQTCYYDCNCTTSYYSCNCSNYSCNCSTCYSCQTCCGYVTRYTYRSYNSGGCIYIGGNQWQCSYQNYECGDCNCSSYSCNCQTCQSCNTCSSTSCQSCSYSCNCQTCQSCSTCCDFGSWSAWTEVASCTTSTPSCSNGATQVECMIA